MTSAFRHLTYRATDLASASTRTASGRSVCRSVIAPVGLAHHEALSGRVRRLTVERVHAVHRGRRRGNRRRRVFPRSAGHYPAVSTPLEDGLHGPSTGEAQSAARGIAPVADYGELITRLGERFDAFYGEIVAGHNFEYGPEFEVAACRCLRVLLPAKYGVCRGYVGRRRRRDISRRRHHHLRSVAVPDAPAARDERLFAAAARPR